MAHLAVIHLPMVHRRTGFRLSHLAVIHLRMIHRAFGRLALRHRAVIHSVMTFGRCLWTGSVHRHCHARMTVPSGHRTMIHG
jgi:hypothetical protein